MSFFSALGRFFSAFARKFASLFQNKVVVDFLSDNRDLAERIIWDVSTALLTPDEKRQSAFHDIANSLKAAGKSFKPHLVNLLIELVFAQLKAEERIE